MTVAAGPSRPSFRPRPIDLAKPLPIIKSSKDLRHEDDIVVNRALPTIATGVDPSEEEERHLQQALLASVFGNSDKPPDIPVPVVSAVQPPSFKSDFTLPEKYVIFDKTDTQLIQHAVEYDADFVDEAFAKKSNIHIQIVELAMDAFEKAQGNVETLLPTLAACPQLPTLATTVDQLQRGKLFTHWRNRRQKLKRPFLRYFQPAPDPNDIDPAVAFRPRDREAGVTIAHRMNTYDNYRRALIIRDELAKLRKILSDVVEREKKKEKLLSINFLLQRIKITTSAAPQIDNIVKHVFCSESEPVLQLPSNKGAFSNSPSHALVPCRGLQVSSDIAIENRRLIVDKVPKKHRRKSKAPDRRNGKDPSNIPEDTDRSSSPVAPQSAFDTFGYDEHGNRFLKLMRCFAGGFINYGVSPYDHRVFAAASERNTVRALPREPKPVCFPDSRLKFAEPVNRVRRGGKVGPRFVSPADMKRDIVNGRNPPELDAADMRPSKARRVTRVRGRVGRGGRVIFDRVPFERERGAKAASYPASVEMGGVYTGSVPLDAAKRVSGEVSYGALGEISQLSPTSVRQNDSHHVLGPQTFTDELFTPLKPMVQAAKGIGVKPDVTNFWPRRSENGHPDSQCSENGHLKSQSDRTVDPKRGETVGADDQGINPSFHRGRSEEVGSDNLRKLPAYCPRHDSSVHDIV